MSTDAEFTKDVLQSFFLEMWERRDRFDEVKDMGAYLHTSFHRKLLRELKVRRSNLHVSDEKLNTESSPSWETLLIQSQKKRRKRATSKCTRWPSLRTKAHAPFSFFRRNELR